VPPRPPDPRRRPVRPARDPRRCRSRGHRRSPGDRSSGSTIRTSPATRGLERAKRIKRRPRLAVATRTCAPGTDAERGLRRSIRSQTGGRSPRTREAGPIPARRANPRSAPARSGRGRRAVPGPRRHAHAGRGGPAGVRGTRPRSRSGRRSRISCPREQLAALSVDGDGRGWPVGSAAASRPGFATRSDGVFDRARPVHVPRRTAERAVPAIGRGSGLTRGWGRCVGPAPRLRPERGRGARTDRPARGARRCRASAGLAGQPRVVHVWTTIPMPRGRPGPPDDDEALRGSSLLAQQDAAEAIRGWRGRPGHHGASTGEREGGLGPTSGSWAHALHAFDIRRADEAVAVPRPARRAPGREWRRPR
jgi:hypothetical protein